MIDYEKLMARKFPDVVQEYDTSDTMLYALGLGIGADPMNEEHLKAVYERNANFCALPSMVNVLCTPGFWAMEPDTGITWQKLLHGEQSFTMHAPLPSEGGLIGKTRVTGIVDKGKERGALIHSERELTDATSGNLLATVSTTTFARADGGFGGPEGPTKPVHQLPESASEAVFDHPTQPGLALLYRLNGDYNPLHADPEIAGKAGFERPILHGLCTLGIAAWSITQTLGDGDPASLKHLQLRFSAPVYPGETVRTEMWGSGSEISFRARVVERDVVVLNNGLARLG